VSTTQTHPTHSHYVTFNAYRILQHLKAGPERSVSLCYSFREGCGMVTQCEATWNKIHLSKHLFCMQIKNC